MYFEKMYSDKEFIDLSIDCLSELVFSVYNTLNPNIIREKIIAELEELHFENHNKLVDFLDVQSDNYTYLHGKLHDEITKIFNKLGFCYTARKVYPSPIQFEYVEEKESFVFYRYGTNKVYKEIKLKTLCEKLDSKKFLVF